MTIKTETLKNIAAGLLALAAIGSLVLAAHAVMTEPPSDIQTPPWRTGYAPLPDNPSPLLVAAE